MIWTKVRFVLNNICYHLPPVRVRLRPFMSYTFSSSSYSDNGVSQKRDWVVSLHVHRKRVMCDTAIAAHGFIIMIVIKPLRKLTRHNFILNKTRAR